MREYLDWKDEPDLHILMRGNRSHTMERHKHGVRYRATGMRRPARHVRTNESRNRNAAPCNALSELLICYPRKSGAHSGVAVALTRRSDFSIPFAGDVQTSLGLDGTFATASGSQHSCIRTIAHVSSGRFHDPIGWRVQAQSGDG